MTEKFKVAPFTISAAALRQIEFVRIQYREAFPDDPPVMPGVTLGRQMLDGGRLGAAKVVVGFWRRSESPRTAHAMVQKVSGLDLVFPVPDTDVPAFVGKEVDYTAEEGLFLGDRT